MGKLVSVLISIVILSRISSRGILSGGGYTLCSGPQEKVVFFRLGGLGFLLFDRKHYFFHIETLVIRTNASGESLCPYPAENS